MRLLLDTHTLLWAAVDSNYLSDGAKRVLTDPGNVLYVSAASAWEARAKHRKGNLPGADVLFPDFEAKVKQAGYIPLAITCSHAEAAASFKQGHKDPFDRLLAAQTLVEGMLLISKDRVLDGFGISRIW